MSAHTPGPWTIRIATGTADTMLSRSVNDGGPREAVAVIPFKYGTPEKRAANARLIAAAPTMLAALEHAVSFCHLGHGHFPMAQCGTCKPIIAAIAKAVKP